MRDYNFLVEGLEKTDIARRKMRVFENYCDNTRFKLMKANCWRVARMELQMAPSIITRHRDNLSFFFTQTGEFFWMVELLFQTPA